MRTEQIMDAVVTTLTGLTTTGSNVVRAQVYDSSSVELPGLAIFMGADIVEEMISNSFYDWVLEVVVESRVKTTSQVDELLNTIRGEVHAALFADYTLGLPTIVIDLDAISASEPTLSPDGAQPIAIQRLNYVVKYRTARGDLT
jgi:hypothetical protein